MVGLNFTVAAAIFSLNIKRLPLITFSSKGMDTLSRGKRFWWLLKNRNRNRHQKSFVSNNWDTRRWGNKYKDNK